MQLVVEKELAEVAYRRVDEWFGYLNRIVKIGCPTQDQIERLAEIKASRDVLVHNKGIVGSRYARKSMGRERFAPGEELLITEGYHRESWVLVKEVIADVADAAVRKAGSN